MGTQLLSSKVVIQEEEPTLRQVSGVPTAVWGAVGVTEKGPVGVPVLCTAPEDYKRVFGRYVAAGDVAQAVDGFFLNGGQQAYVTRVVHYSDVTDPDTATSAAATLALVTSALAATAGFVLGSLATGTFDLLATGKTLTCTVDGGSPTTATFNAVAAARESGAGTFVLSNGVTLLVAVDGGTAQSIAFLTGEFVAIGAATAAEVAAVINAKGVGLHATVTNTTKVTITSDTIGTGSGVNITGGTGNGALGYTTGLVSGTGNVANVRAVTVAEVKTVVEAAVSGCTVTNVGGAVRIASNTVGGSSSILVGASSTADTLIGLDNATHTGSGAATLTTLTVDAKYDGAYGNDLSVIVGAATSGEAARFNLSVVKGGVIIEAFANLSMLDTDPLFAETVINDAHNGSEYITVTDADAATTAPHDRPVNGTFGPLTGGNSGLTSLADTDFLGGVGSGSDRTGMRSLDTVQELSLLSVPGRATSAVQNGMVAYCEVTRGGSVFPIFDPPTGMSAVGMVGYMETTAALLNLSEFGAMYWPRIYVVNPDKATFGNDANLLVAPSGYIAGVYARTDGAREGGIYDAPAGIEKGILFGCLGFETDECLDEAKRDLVYPKRINPLTTGRGLPRFIDGSRTLKATGNFPSISERRGVIFIEQSLKDGSQFARHKNNDDALRATLSRTFGTFLVTQMKVGAFRSRVPATAFFVDFGEALNPPATVFAAKVVGRIGLATQKPADFIVLRFSQDTRAFDAAVG